MGGQKTEGRGRGAGEEWWGVCTAQKCLNGEDAVEDGGRRRSRLSMLCRIKRLQSRGDESTRHKATATTSLEVSLALSKLSSS